MHHATIEAGSTHRLGSEGGRDAYPAPEPQLLASDTPGFTDRFRIAIPPAALAERMPAILEETLGSRFVQDRSGELRWRGTVHKAGHRYNVRVRVADHDGDSVATLELTARKGLLAAFGIPGLTVLVTAWWFVVGIFSVLNWRSINAPSPLGWSWMPDAVWPLVSIAFLLVPCLLTMLVFWLTKKMRLDAMPMLTVTDAFAARVRELANGPRVADYRHRPRIQ